MKIKVVGRHGEPGVVELIGPVDVHEGCTMGHLHDKTTGTDYYFNNGDGTFDGTGREPKA